MNHLDLFSGIGGFSLAARWAYGDEHKPIAFCEIDKYCGKVLKKHWPDVPIFEDIRSLDGRQFRDVDLVSGGFPCQPFSVAGKRAGKEDDRFLWPEMVRVISETRPRWIIGENVPGIISLELDKVLFDLEAEGYTCQPIIIPACAVNAPHRRDRVWIIANRKGAKCELSGAAWAGREGFADNGCFVADTESRETFPTEQGGLHAKPCGPDSDVADAGNEGLQGRQWTGTHDTGKAAYGPTAECDNTWLEQWPEVAARLCRVDARVSNRVHRLRALGNAIVPQVAYELLRMIKAIDEQEKARENVAVGCFPAKTTKLTLAASA